MEKRAMIVALALRLGGYVSIGVGVAAGTPLNGALIVLGGAAVVEGLLIEVEQ